MEGRRRITAIKPDAVLINEGSNEASLYAGFHAIYGFSWHSCLYDVMIGGTSAAKMREDWEAVHKRLPAGSRILRDMDNHDTVTDWPGRIETLVGHDGMDLILTLNHVIDGVPMVYCGNELADTAKLSMFANRFHPGKYSVTRRDEAAKQTPAALQRQKLLRQLISLRKEDILFREGETVWLEQDQPDTVIAFCREYEGRKLWFIANTGTADVTVTVDEPISAAAQTLIASAAERQGETTLVLKGRGFILLRA